MCARVDVYFVRGTKRVSAAAHLSKRRDKMGAPELMCVNERRKAVQTAPQPSLN